MDCFLAGTSNVNESLLVPITIEELLRSQLNDEVCAEIRSRLNGGEEIPFALDTDAARYNPFLR